MTALTLDRVEIEDVGANPRRLADAIHCQLGWDEKPVPVYAIARALDIIEIREERLTNIEGALVTTPARSHGSVLVNAASSRQRRRFTLAHELGHFLNPWHRPTAPEGFRCSRADMLVEDRSSSNQFARQEGEANTFAIELLTPRTRVAQFLEGEPDLQRVRSMALAFDISREAAARRYVALHDETLAILFSSGGKFRYADSSNSFPRIALRKGQAMPPLPAPSRTDSLSATEAVHHEDWLSSVNAIQVTAQTLHQQDGFAITLLSASFGTAKDEEDVEDTFERFSRFSRL